MVMVQAQIAGSELGVTDIVVLDADTQVGSAGSSSASRQTYITGGAVKAAAEAVCKRVCEMAQSELYPASVLKIENDSVVGADGKQIVSLATLLGDAVIEETREFHPRATHRLDPETGQADAHVQYAFAAHRAVVDVDTELGLVKVVELTSAQDVGKAMNPLALEGQIHGGTAQGLGLALMEEIQVVDGMVRNPSFTDYLIPTILDMPPMHLDILELPDPHAPYGLRGVGEPPTISATPAVVAAIRAATGRPRSGAGNPSRSCASTSRTGTACGPTRKRTWPPGRRVRRSPRPAPRRRSSGSGARAWRATRATGRCAQSTCSSTRSARRRTG